MFRNLLFAYCLFFVGCSYKFTSAALGPDIKTFYVQRFENRATNVVPTLAITFAERLRDKIRNEMRLRPNNTEPDIEMLGYISKYDVTAESPKPGETVAFNKLTITVYVEYMNHKDEKKNLKQDFTRFRTFPASSNLIDVQEQLIKEITDELLDSIFDVSFNNW
jgi:Lipopolysaccharide-assembly